MIIKILLSLPVLYIVLAIVLLISDVYQDGRDAFTAAFGLLIVIVVIFIIASGILKYLFWIWG